MAALSSTAAANTAGQIPSALVITKSSNKNEVNYAVEVDDACEPVGPAPVHPYWRMIERGEGVTQGLRSDELRVLGIAHQEIGPGFVRLSIRGMPNRDIVIHTWRAANGACETSADTTIAGVPARIANVYVREKMFGIAYVQLTGWASGGTVVREQVK